MVLSQSRDRQVSVVKTSWGLCWGCGQQHDEGLVGKVVLLWITEWVVVGIRLCGNHRDSHGPEIDEVMNMIGRIALGGVDFENWWHGL